MQVQPVSRILFYVLGEIMSKYAAITGWGMAVPERVLTNAELERMVSTSDEWIQTRTGIRERRVVGPGESTSTLSTAAGAVTSLQLPETNKAPDAKMPRKTFLSLTVIGALWKTQNVIPWARILPLSTAAYKGVSTDLLY